VSLVLEQLRDTFILILLGAALVSAVSRDAADTLVIGVVVLVNTALGVVQQRKAQRAIDALRSLSVPTAVVVREGRPRRVPAPEVVEGDLVVVQAGDQVPADVRLLEAADLWADESLLTGESVPVQKETAPVEVDTPVADRTCLLHAGTLLTRGRGRGVVVGTGSRSELGRLARLVEAATPPPTPLQRRLAGFGRRIAVLVVILCGVVLVAGVMRGEPLLTMTLAAVSLAVAAVPESLPAVVAVSLALAARRMAERSAIVRTLPAVEALGAVTVIASDKTGTLTEGRLSARELWTPWASATAEGLGYAPTGALRGERKDHSSVSALLEACALCNDAHLVHQEGEWDVTGDPLEGALLALAARGGVDVDALRRSRDRLAEVPFDHARSRMTTVHALPDGRCLLVCKGAPESVLGLVAGPTRAAHDAADALAAEGLRVLAVAARELPSNPLDVAAEEHDLELLGLVGLLDPPREGVAEAVRACTGAGVLPVMITGDHPETAAAVARDLGILVEGTSVLTGRELASGAPVDPETTRVFARTAPEQKLDIVDGLRAAGHVVAMTGDGVNDAPALRRADVGVAMGRSGSDVARQAADVVLLDDDFGTIVAAVEEGRRVYDNIRRFLVYGLSGGAAEVLVMLVGPFLGMTLPLLPAQVLWVNLLTHGFPGVALGAERGETDALRRAPRDPAEGVLGGGLAVVVLAAGALMGLTALTTAVVARAAGAPWQSTILVTLTLQQLWLALTIRSTRRSLLSIGTRGNPLLVWSVAVNVALLLLAVTWSPLMSLLSTERLGAGELGWCLLVSLTTPALVEAVKAVRAGRHRAEA
jgi:Ca2+-transporting ATPase